MVDSQARSGTDPSPTRPPDALPRVSDTYPTNRSRSRQRFCKLISATPWSGRRASGSGSPGTDSPPRFLETVKAARPENPVVLRRCDRQLAYVGMQAVKRAFDIVSSVARLGADGVSLSDLSDETGLPPSTLHRHVTVLVELGYLRRGASKLVSLGARSVALGASIYDPDALAGRTRAALRSLHAATRETSFASQLVGTDVVCVEMVPGAYPLQLSVRVGQTIPPLHAASARAVLAYADQAVAEASWAGSADGGDRLEEFLDQLHGIRARGYDICDSEFDHGVWAVAAPVISVATGELYGALAVAGAADRFKTSTARTRTIDLVVEAAAALSSQT